MQISQKQKLQGRKIMTLNGFNKHKTACHQAGGKLQARQRMRESISFPSSPSVMFTCTWPGKKQKYKPSHLRVEASQKYAPPTCLHIFMVQSQEEQIKLTQSLIIYLYFPYFEDNCMIFGTLGEWQSCSQFPPLPTLHQLASCSCWSPGPSSPREGLSSRREEKHNKHSMVSAPLFHAARDRAR